MEGGRRADGVPADVVARTVMWRWALAVAGEMSRFRIRRHITRLTTEDLKIAEIALVNNALLLSAN